MRCEEFVSILEATMPTEAELRAAGVSADTVVMIRDMHRAPRRASQRSTQGCSELERLILDHDCSRVEVAMVRFIDAPCPHARGVQVALEEADPIVVKPDGGVAVFDHAVEDFEILACARDSEHFLAALAKRLEIGAARASWLGRAEEAIAACATIAGGSQYAAFFGGLHYVLNRAR